MLGREEVLPKDTLGRVSLRFRNFSLTTKGPCAGGQVKKRKSHPGKTGGIVGKEMPTNLSVKYE